MTKTDRKEMVEKLQRALGLAKDFLSRPPPSGKVQNMFFLAMIFLYAEISQLDTDALYQDAVGAFKKWECGPFDMQGLEKVLQQSIHIFTRRASELLGDRDDRKKNLASTPEKTDCHGRVLH